jgi:hypothetical protein
MAALDPEQILAVARACRQTDSWSSVKVAVFDEDKIYILLSADCQHRG